MSDSAHHLPTGVESEITGFDSSKLKHAECHEKTCLPTKDGITLFEAVFSFTFAIIFATQTLSITGHKHAHMVYFCTLLIGGPGGVQHRIGSRRKWTVVLLMLQDIFLTCYY